jgi:hypothetical protein
MQSLETLNCVSLIQKKITVKLIFGVAQALLASSCIVLALFLRSDLFNAQSSLSIGGEVLNFYVMILLALGLVLVLGGLFLVYDWWESR